MYIHLYKTLENANQSIVKENRAMIPWGKGWKGVGGRDYKGHEETFGSDGCVHNLACGDSFMCIYISQLIQLYTLHMYCLLYVNYSLIKLFKNKPKHNKKKSRKM